jgi:hypothetical protein
VAGHLPVELLVVGKGVQGALEVVGDDVALLAADELVRVADLEDEVRPLAAGRVSPGVLAVRDAGDVDAVFAVVLVVIPEDDVQVARDAMVLVAAKVDEDVLDDVDGAVGPDVVTGAEGAYDEVVLGGGRSCQEQQGQQREDERD